MSGNRLLSAVVLLAIALLLFAEYGITYGQPVRAAYNVVVYGGGPQGFAAALRAAETAGATGRVLLVAPEKELGSVLTEGRQNLIDWNYFQSGSLPPGLPADWVGAQGGTAYELRSAVTDVFDPGELARWMRHRLSAHPGVAVLTGAEVEEVRLSRDARRVVSVLVTTRGGRRIIVEAPVFVDASETGRLVTMAGAPVTVGRGDGRQMAATLMYRVRGLDPSRAEHRVDTGRGWVHVWGGYDVERLPQFVRYNADASHPFRIKPYNAGSVGPYSGPETEWWVNGLLIYGVDGRKYRGDERVAGGGWSQPEAREAAIREIARPEFTERMRLLPGWERAQLVVAGGRPVVGEILYIRESVHSRRGSGYGLESAVALGDDTPYRRTRIGLGYYQLDSNTYRKGERLSNPDPERPWYVPYETLVPGALDNVLVPGYAASIDPMMWTAMRVYPNLLVLGDAAGVAAGLACRGMFDIANPTGDQIALLQERLRAINAILDR